MEESKKVEPVAPSIEPERVSQVNKVINTLIECGALKPIEPVKEKETEFFLPPDHGDICWEVGSETFTRKEVFYLLWTQRAMIVNDIKRNVLTVDQNSRAFLDVLNVLDHIRIPKF